MKYLRSFEQINNEIRKLAWHGQKYEVPMPDGSIKEVYADDVAIQEAHEELYNETKQIPTKQQVLERAFEKYKGKYKDLSNKAMYMTTYPKDEVVCSTCRDKEGEVIDIDPPLPIGSVFPARTHSHCRCNWKVIQGI